VAASVQISAPGVNIEPSPTRQSVRMPPGDPFDDCCARSAKGSHRISAHLTYFHSQHPSPRPLRKSPTAPTGEAGDVIRTPSPGFSRLLPAQVPRGAHPRQVARYFLCPRPDNVPREPQPAHNHKYGYDVPSGFRLATAAGTAVPRNRLEGQGPKRKNNDFQNEDSVPRYKFKWSNLPSSLLKDLCRDLLGLPEDDGDWTGAMQTAYGARPTVEFIRDAWPTLLESWLRTDSDSRQRVVNALEQARGGKGLIKGRRAQGRVPGAV
jgi:hypothetical protein